MAIAGSVRGHGTKYKGNGERLEIHVAKTEHHGLPAKDGSRVPITLNIGGREYSAGLRSRPRFRFVWICPDLVDNETKKDTKLTFALEGAGIKKNQKITLEVMGNMVTVRVPS